MGARISLRRRLTADAATLDAQELQSDVAQCAATPIALALAGQVALVTGRLRAVAYTPRETVPTLHAELFDGSGSVELVWMGRRRITGIEPGRQVFARGRIGEYEGKPAIFNPWYQLREPA